MRKYSCVQALVMSFYSRDFYRDAARNWGGGVLLYLLLLLSISWLLITIDVQAGINQIYTRAAPHFFKQIPVITIKNGEAQTPEQKPYFIVEPDHNKVVAVIDTTGKYNNLQDANTSLLVTKDAVIFSDSSGSTRIREFSKNLNVVVNPTQIQKVSDRFAGWVWVLLFPIFLLFSFIYRIIQAMIYAIFGKIFAAMSNVYLTYDQVFKIAIFAITPSVLIGTVLDAFYLTFRFEWLLFFILSMAYLIYGIRANKY